MARSNNYTNTKSGPSVRGGGGGDGGAGGVQSIVDISDIPDAVDVDSSGHVLEADDKTAIVRPHSSASASHLYLYHDENTLGDRQRVPASMSSFTATPVASDKAHSHHHHQQHQHHYHNQSGKHRSRTADSGVDAAASDGLPATEPTEHKANLGTLSGVYFPCVQNIFGVILFIRMVWIVGTAGIPAAFTLVLICCLVTLCTSISLSAIATNGIVPAGGSYFMISRSLGPEFGGAVGTLFFLGTTVAGAMYTTGAVEIMLNYMSPQLGLFGDFQRDTSVLYNNIRVYGTLLLAIIGGIVLIGVRFVSKFAPVALFCVLFSIACIYAGIFINYDGKPDLQICVLGDRLVTLKSIQTPYSRMLEQQQSSSSANTNSNSQQQQRSTYYDQQGANNLSASALYLMHVHAACTYEMLRPIFCNASLHNTDQAASALTPTAQQQQQYSSRSYGGDSSGSQSGTSRAFDEHCDPYFVANIDRIHLEKAVPGIASGVFWQNLAPRFRQKHTIVSYDDGVSQSPHDYNQVFVDISTSFTILIAIYFPSCTGILAGSNRSGDLADAQRSIPMGTIAAQLTTSFVYLSCIVLFGSSFNNLFIRDKFGESVGGQLAVTQIAWPHPYVILVGGLLSTLGAALQSLVGAPRLLQAIAKDQVIPCLNGFAQSAPNGEPRRAIYVSLALAECAVLIGNLDFIAPILTLSLVMCYLFVNLACTLQSLLRSPNWRPRFRHYHWSISLLGCFLCLFVMFVSSWVYTVIALLLASCIYKYIEFHGAEKEWGDGLHGLALSAARYSLLRLELGEPHTKNWRPQILLFCKLRPRSLMAPPSMLAANPPPALAGQAAALTVCPRIAITMAPATGTHSSAPTTTTTTTSDVNNNNKCIDGMILANDDELCVAHPKLLTFAAQLKAGKGLTLVSSVIEGDFQQLADVAVAAKANLQSAMVSERVKGFADVLIARAIMDGLSYQIQTAGLGGLKHNTVIVAWPTRWRQRATSSSLSAGAVGAGQEGKPTRASQFIETMKTVQASHNALLVVKGIDSWPESCDKLGGYIDIWWIVHDGGLLMLLPHLLKQHRTWKSCQLRVYTVAQPEDNSIQMRDDLKRFLYHLRIDAQVDIVEMGDSEISDYAYERTLIMEQRSEIMKRLANNRKQSVLLEQVDGRVIRFTIRKTSLSEYDTTVDISTSNNDSDLSSYPMVSMGPSTSTGATATAGQPTSSNNASNNNTNATNKATSNDDGLLNLKPDEANVRRMHTAIRLNEAILQKSRNAKLIILNMPGAPKTLAKGADNNYMEFIEVLTEGLERVLLVQGGGREVITIHS